MLEDREEILRYLDESIDWWRKVRAEAGNEAYRRAMADCYVDAFQSMRMTIFGEVKA
jgi:hypothetical protein